MKTGFLLVILFAGCMCFAQTGMVVHLKNGSAVRGELISEDSTGVKIRTRDGSYYNYSLSEIESIEKFTPSISKSGFYNKTSVGVLGGAQISGSLNVVNGYAFNEHFEAGFGLGIESFVWDPYIPVFLEGRFNFLTGRTRPYVSATAGYEVPLIDIGNMLGGLTTGAEIGMTHYFAQHVGISTSIGYRFLYLKERSWWDDSFISREMHRFEVRLGFVFR